MLDALEPAVESCSMRSSTCCVVLETARHLCILLETARHVESCSMHSTAFEAILNETKIMGELINPVINIGAHPLCLLIAHAALLSLDFLSSNRFVSCEPASRSPATPATPPRPPRVSAAPQTPPKDDGVLRELEWAKAALQSRLDYLDQPR